MLILRPCFFILLIIVFLSSGCGHEEDYFIFNVTNKRPSGILVPLEERQNSAILVNPSILNFFSFTQSGDIEHNTSIWASDDVYVRNINVGKSGGDENLSEYSVDESYYQAVLTGFDIFFHGEIIKCVELFFRPFSYETILSNEYYIKKGKSCGREAEHISWFADNSLNEIITGVRITTTKDCSIDGIGAWSSPIYNSKKEGILSKKKTHITNTLSYDGLTQNPSDYIPDAEIALTGIAIYGDFELNSCKLEMDVKSRILIIE